jgi:hypothetical protein
MAASVWPLYADLSIAGLTRFLAVRGVAAFTVKHMHQKKVIEIDKENFRY